MEEGEGEGEGGFSFFLKVAVLAAAAAGDFGSLVDGEDFFVLLLL